MYFDTIIHGTQYYRAPTPLPAEWEGDIANFEAFQLDAFQIRINWRWNERVEDQYDFSDIDKLLELAKKYNRKVIMKFLLECAPQYIYEKYDGTRIGPKGELLRPGSHGAFYGGWMPCFTNPMVKERAAKFVEACASRYAGNESIILWNAWNEIRNRPIEECFCPHCRREFGKFLQTKFGTIEALNAHYGAAEESFEAINLPSTAHGYWDLFEFKKFKGSACLANNLQFVYDAIRKFDKTTPIMAHTGVCSAFQETIGDVCDDFTVSKAVDFWGTSLPFDTNMDTPDNRLNMLLLTDFLRSVDKNYFIHEIYPGLGMFRAYDTPFDLKFKLYSGLAGGAKGLVYWQYRAERVGYENDCAGIMNMDGTPREVAYAARDFGVHLKKDMRYFVNASPEKSQAAIVFDFDSLLIGEIAETCLEDFNLKRSTGRAYYKHAHTGLYRLLHDAGYRADYVGITNPEQFGNYKMLFFPYCTMLDPSVIPYLEEFLKNGGIIYADEGFAMRQRNTWMQIYDLDTKPILNARLRFRRETTEADTLVVGGELTKILPYQTEYRVDGGTALKQFQNGADAMFEVRCGKGTLYLNGFSTGYSYFSTLEKGWISHIAAIMQKAGIRKEPYGDFANSVYVRRMNGPEGKIIFLFNQSDTERILPLDAEPLSYGADARIEHREMHVKPGEIGYVILP